jgi:hypothetical protein
MATVQIEQRGSKCTTFVLHSALLEVWMIVTVVMVQKFLYSVQQIEKIMWNFISSTIINKHVNNTALNGQHHEIFDFRFFFMNQFPPKILSIPL